MIDQSARAVFTDLFCVEESRNFLAKLLFYPVVVLVRFCFVYNSIDETPRRVTVIPPLPLPPRNGWEVWKCDYHGPYGVSLKRKLLEREINWYFLNGQSNNIHFPLWADPETSVSTRKFSFDLTRPQVCWK